MTDVSPTPSIDALIALFDAELGDVSFPGASLADLSAQRATLEEARAQVETLRRELDDALAGYQRTRALLQATAERGHAYAAVYAKDHPALVEKLDAIQFGDAPKRRKKRERSEKSEKASAPAKRGAKRAEGQRAASEMAPLPFEATAAMSEAS